MRANYGWVSGVLHQMRGQVHASTANRRGIGYVTGFDLPDFDVPAFDAAAEFDRQVATLVAKGYPNLAGLSGTEFVARLAPLREVALADSWIEPPSRGWVPFVLVITPELVSTAQSMPLTRLAFGSRPGFVDRLFEPSGLGAFQPVPELAVPRGGAYLLINVERGERFGNLAPEAALATIAGQGRTPLTIAEGIALITQYPHLLEHNKYFSLAGSRAGDRRVPALWISQHAPKLGWSWAGAPQAGLGVASAGERVGVGVDERRILQAA